MGSEGGLRAWEKPTCVFNNNYDDEPPMEKVRDIPEPWSAWFQNDHIGSYATWREAMAAVDQKVFEEWWANGK